MGFVALWVSITQFLAQLPDGYGMLEEIWRGQQCPGMSGSEQLVSACQRSGWHSDSLGEKPLYHLTESTSNPKADCEGIRWAASGGVVKLGTCGLGVLSGGMQL